MPETATRAPSRRHYPTVVVDYDPCEVRLTLKGRREILLEGFMRSHGVRYEVQARLEWHRHGFWHAAEVNGRRTDGGGGLTDAARRDLPSTIRMNLSGYWGDRIPEAVWRRAELEDHLDDPEEVAGILTGLREQIDTLQAEYDLLLRRYAEAVPETQ